LFILVVKREFSKRLLFVVVVPPQRIAAREKPAPSQCAPNRLTLLNIWGSTMLLLLRLALGQRTKVARLLQT
jgi:hypothetical protein